MTLPITSTLPIHSDKIIEGGAALDKYMKELIVTLQRQYEDMAEAINGTVRRSVDNGSSQWLPVLRDSANPTTTFTYDHQVGYVLREGIMVDAFFDIKWTANTGAITGNMYVDLPYKVAITNQKPFVGVVQPSIFAYTGGTECVINAQSNTYQGDIWNVGDGFTTANQSSVAAGHLIGTIKYVSQGLERS